MFQKAVPTQDVTNSVNHPSFYCFQGILFLFVPPFANDPVRSGSL